MLPQAPPRRVPASHGNGFSYLSWKRKTVLAVIVIISGGGLAAQFPSLPVPDESVAVSSDSADSAQSDYDDVSPSLSYPQNRYANNARSAEKGNGPSLAEPNVRIEKYTEPPAINGRGESEDSPPALQSSPSRILRKFESINYAGFERTPLDLPLARWNPLFDQSPPLSVHSLQPLIDSSVIVPAQPEAVQVMKPATESQTEPLISVWIDSSQITPAEDREVTVLIPATSIVPADQDYP